MTTNLHAGIIQPLCPKNRIKKYTSMCTGKTVLDKINTENSITCSLNRPLEIGGHFTKIVLNCDGEVYF